jgi:outer membrane protein OmpA-like peptidoglycan-associated protein
MKSQDEWMSISDMMSGLMLIFMFIAISFMIQVESDKEKLEENNKKLEILMKNTQKDKNRIKNIAITYNKDKKELNIDFHKEFLTDLKKWEARITDDNIIIFNSPTVLFQSGKSIIKKDFKTILNDFFPRYIKILSSLKYREQIDEVRIEGHTSNSWKNSISLQKIYLKNMQLSQDRANQVLSYCYSLNNTIIDKSRKWLELHLRANGMAFAKLQYEDSNRTIVDQIKSRRVEFKVQMKTEEKIYKILKASE